MTTMTIPDAATIRKADAPIDPMFLDRWSPRAFSNKPVPRETLRTLFEAARWAPSCFNEQPWLFLYAATAEDLALFRPLLVEGNRRWADHAPVLAFVLARRNFEKNDKPNRWAAFDCGAAWMALALEARKLGLYTHGMAGFHEDRVYDALGVRRTVYEAIAAIAIGFLGDPAQLPDEIRANEKPNGRKPAESFAYEGRYPGPKPEEPGATG